MPRVLHVIDAVVSADMLQQLAMLVGEGDAIASVGRPPQGADFDVPVAAVHSPLGSAALSALRMGELARSAEIVHSWSPVGLRAGEVIARRFGPRHVASVPCCPRQERLARMVRRLKQGRLTLTLPTRIGRQTAVQAGAPEGSVHVLPPPAAAMDQPESRRRGTREALGIGDEVRIMIAPAEMRRDAGHRYASWAHAIVRQIREDLVLLLPGGGPLERSVRFFAETTSYGCEEIFSGSRFPLPDALAAADLAVFFQQRDVGVAALVAAMAGGLPIAAAATPDVAECTADGEAALLIPRSDPGAASAAVLKLLEDAPLAKSLATAARARASEQFSPALCRAHLEEVYSAALRQSGP